MYLIIYIVVYIGICGIKFFDVGKYICIYVIRCNNSVLAWLTDMCFKKSWQIMYTYCTSPKVD
jgi:hypothetical protein